MQLQVFKYASGKDQIFEDVRTIEIDGELWFVASDIARNLGYKQPKDAVLAHCKPKGAIKRRLSSATGLKSMTLINEPNVYRLIIKSQLPTADKFEDWLFEEVVPSIRKTGGYGKVDRIELPNFIERYKDNIHKIPHDYFSVISEMFVRLYNELEKAGYSIPDRNSKGAKIMPDISVGKAFSMYLKNTESTFFKARLTYQHAFPDGRIVSAYMYPIQAIPEFISFIHGIWIPEYAESYFKRADPKALDYLPKLIGYKKSGDKLTAFDRAVLKIAKNPKKKASKAKPGTPVKSSGYIPSGDHTGK